MIEYTKSKWDIHLPDAKKTKRVLGSALFAGLMILSPVEAGVASQINKTQPGKTFQAGRQLLLAREQPSAYELFLPPNLAEKLHEINDPRIVVGVGDSEVWGNAWSHIKSRSFLDEMTAQDPSLQTINLGKPGISTQKQSHPRSLEDFYTLPPVGSSQKYDAIVLVGGNDFQKLAQSGEQAQRYKDILEFPPQVVDPSTLPHGPRVLYELENKTEGAKKNIEQLQVLPGLVYDSVSLIHDHRPALGQLLRNIIAPTHLREGTPYRPPDTIYVLNMLPFHQSQNLCTVGFDRTGSICFRLDSKEKRDLVYRGGILMNQQKEAAIADVSVEFPKQRIVLVNVFDLDDSIFLPEDQHLSEQGNKIVAKRVVEAIHTIRYQAFLAK